MFTNVGREQSEIHFFPPTEAPSELFHVLIKVKTPLSSGFKKKARCGICNNHANHCSNIWACCNFLHLFLHGVVRTACSSGRLITATKQHSSVFWISMKRYRERLRIKGHAFKDNLFPFLSIHFAILSVPLPTGPTHRQNHRVYSTTVTHCRGRKLQNPGAPTG